MKTFEEFMRDALPLLLNHMVTKIESDTVQGKVTCYWTGTVIRIDLKPQLRIEEDGPEQD